MTDEREQAAARRDRSTYRSYRRQDGSYWKVTAVNPGHSYDVVRVGHSATHVLAPTCDAALTLALERQNGQ